MVRTVRSVSGGAAGPTTISVILCWTRTDDSARPGCGAVSQPPGRGAPTQRLGRMDSPTKPEDELLRPLAAGSLVVQTVREGQA